MTNWISEKKILVIIAASLAVKLALFGYTLANVPSAKFMPDTPTYIEPGINLIEKGVFGTFDENGRVKYEIIRTPGYPLFIAILKRLFGLSLDAIIVVQILLITFAGYVIYRAVYEFDRKGAFLAAFIFLFDQPTTISALMLLTEALYAVFMAFFIYFFLKYLSKYKVSSLIFSVLMLVIATYIRPVSYYLGICLAAGVLYLLFLKNIKRAIAHALILLLLFYVPVGAWNYRNYLRIGTADFTTIDNQDLSHMGITHKYVRAGGYEETKVGPFRYYANLVASSTIQFFTIPGTLKYLKSVPIKAASKVYGYPWVAFWLMGLFFARYDKMPYRFLLLIILYYLMASVVVTGLCVGSRFRVPIMPLIAILSASGWVRIAERLLVRLWRNPAN